jgi:hypothetical protein
MPFDDVAGDGGRAWRWWRRGDPEFGLQGFACCEERDAFSAGGSGPFRRVVAPPGGRTVRQVPRPARSFNGAEA